MKTYLNILNKVFSNKFAVQTFGILIAIAIVATGAYIDHQQQDQFYYQRQGQVRDPQQIEDPAVVLFSEVNDPMLETDVVDNSYSFDVFGTNMYLQILASNTHNRLIVFVDSTDGVTYRGKVNTLEKLALENNASLLAVNYLVDGPSDAELFLAPGVSTAFTDQEAATLIHDKVKPALAAYRLEYALMLVMQQFSQETTGHKLILDSAVQSEYSHTISKPGTTKVDVQDTHVRFDGYAAEAQRNAVNGTWFLVVLCVMALLLIWKTPSRYWGFVYGGSIAYAIYQTMQLSSSDTVDLTKPHTLFMPAVIVIIAGAFVGYFVDYLISIPAKGTKKK